MSRYIDADATRDLLIKSISLTNGIDTALKDAPSIDIVRCKECKSYIDFIGEQFINAPTLCGRLSTLDNYVAVNADDFCSYGERRE